MPSNSVPGQHRLLPLVMGQVLAAGALSAQAATITVDDSSGTAGGANCTLRDAISAANSDAVVAGCSAGSGPDTINLPSGATITLGTVDNGDNCLPLVDSDISLAGNGSTIRRDPAGPACRLFEVANDGITTYGALTINDATISNGYLNQGPNKGFPDYYSGGAILSSGGDVSLNGTVLSNNQAGYGGAVTVKYADLTLTGSTLSGNTAGNIGGGAYVYAGSFYSYGSNIQNNTAPVGGGVLVYGTGRAGKQAAATLAERSRDWSRGSVLAARAKGQSKYGVLLVDSTVSGNTATGFTAQPEKMGRRAKGILLPPGYGFAGGLGVYGTIAYLYDSRLQNNVSFGFGGGGGSKYGGIFAVESTISGNTALLGGGLSAGGGYNLLGYSSVSGNQANYGGGLGAIYGGVIIGKSTISGNRAEAPMPLKGPIQPNYSGGGGLFGYRAYLLSIDSTISANQAATEAAAIAWGRDDLPLFNTPMAQFQTLQFPGNRSGAPSTAGLAPTGDSPSFKYDITLLQSTIANNTITAPAAGKGGGSFAVQFDLGTAVGIGNTVISNPGIGDCTTLDMVNPTLLTSLIRDGSCGATLSGDPLLGPLANNGGPTLTHLPLAGSPLFNAGDPTLCADSSPQDQTGAPRPTDGTTSCTVGAVQGMPIGPAEAVAIPTLGQWSRTLLAGLLGVLGYLGLRRRRRPGEYS